MVSMIPEQVDRKYPGVECNSSKISSVLLTACFFWVQLRLFTKQLTRRQVTLRATYHMTRETRVRWVTQQSRTSLASCVSLDWCFPCLVAVSMPHDAS